MNKKRYSCLVMIIYRLIGHPGEIGENARYINFVVRFLRNITGLHMGQIYSNFMIRGLASFAPYKERREEYIRRYIKLSGLRSFSGPDAGYLFFLFETFKDECQLSMQKLFYDTISVGMLEDPDYIKHRRIIDEMYGKEYPATRK